MYRPSECSTCQRLSVPDGHAAERKSPTGMRPLRCHTREMAFVVLQQQRRISRMPTDEAEAKEVSTCISDALTCRAPMQFYPTVLYSPGCGIVLPRVHRSNGPIKWRMRMCCLGKPHLRRHGRSGASLGHRRGAAVSFVNRPRPKHPIRPGVRVGAAI